MWACWPVVSSEGATGPTGTATGCDWWVGCTGAPAAVWRARAWSDARTPVDEADVASVELRPAAEVESRRRPDFSQGTLSSPHCRGRGEVSLRSVLKKAPSATHAVRNVLVMVNRVDKRQENKEDQRDDGKVEDAEPEHLRVGPNNVSAGGKGPGDRVEGPKYAARVNSCVDQSSSSSKRRPYVDSDSPEDGDGLCVPRKDRWRGSADRGRDDVWPSSMTHDKVRR